jgi:hypothetical protein
MNEMNELLASNDPMGTPIAAIGPPPPINTTPQGGSNQNVAVMHERTVEQQLAPPTTPQKKPPQSGITQAQREAFAIACCAFIVLLPNVQQLMHANLPVLASNTTLLTLVNAVLVAVLYFLLKDHVLELI